MLAAAIRASLIEAGEPDTSHQTPPSASSQPGPSPAPHNIDSTQYQQDQQKQHQHQQQAGSSLPASTFASPFQRPEQQQQGKQGQHQGQGQQQGQGQRHQLRFQEKQLPNGDGLPSEHTAAALQFGDLAAALQDTESAGAQVQGNSEWGTRQVSGALPEGQLRSAKSSDGVMGRGSQDGSADTASPSGAGG